MGSRYLLSASMPQGITGMVQRKGLMMIQKTGRSCLPMKGGLLQMGCTGLCPQRMHWIDLDGKESHTVSPP